MYDCLAVVIIISLGSWTDLRQFDEIYCPHYCKGKRFICLSVYFFLMYYLGDITRHPWLSLESFGSWMLQAILSYGTISWAVVEVRLDQIFSNPAHCFWEVGACILLNLIDLNQSSPETNYIHMHLHILFPSKKFFLRQVRLSVGVLLNRNQSDN